MQRGRHHRPPLLDRAGLPRRRTTVHTSLTKNGAAQDETDVYNTYDVKWDSLLTHATELNKSNVVVAPSNDSVDAASYYEYDTGGRLTEVKVQDDFPRNVRLVNNAFGQVITRTEFSSAASNPPRRILRDRSSTPRPGGSWGQAT